MAEYRHVPSRQNQYIQNGSGAKLNYWPKGQSVKKKAFPMFLTNITWSGIETLALDTTHLLTTPPSAANQFGGRTSTPALLADPGELTLEGFLNPSVILPKGLVIWQLVFPKPVGHVIPAKWICEGFIRSRGAVTITVDTLITQQTILKISGNVAVSLAQRKVAV